MPVQCCPRWSRHTVRHSFGEDEHERLQENPRRDRRRRHARRNRPRLHPGFRRILQQLRIRWIWWRVWLQPALLRLQQLFVLQQLFLLWLRPPVLRLRLRPPLRVGWFLALATFGYRPWIPTVRIVRAYSVGGPATLMSSRGHFASCGLVRRRSTASPR